jgi:outer membrane murein-binding lipoprotein Lpp
MKTTIVISILGALLVAGAVFGNIQHTNAKNVVKNIEQEMQQIQTSYDELNHEYEQLNSRYDYLSQQYQDLEHQYVALGYQYQVMGNRGAEEEDELADAQQQIAYWKDAYEAKPGPWQTLREFRSEEELVLWLSQDNTDSNRYIPNQFDCDDFACMLQARAYDDGYMMSITLVARNDGYHFNNGCFIGNKFYYIDPQTDRFWSWGHLD